MGGDVDGATLALILGVVFGAASWLFKGKIEEIDRKIVTAITKIFEIGERLSSLEAKNEALQRQVDREGEQRK